MTDPSGPPKLRIDTSRSSGDSTHGYISFEPFKEVNSRDEQGKSSVVASSTAAPSHPLHSEEGSSPITKRIVNVFQLLGFGLGGSSSKDPKTVEADQETLSSELKRLCELNNVDRILSDRLLQSVHKFAPICLEEDIPQIAQNLFDQVIKTDSEMRHLNDKPPFPYTA